MKKLMPYFRDYRKECVLAPLFKMLEASFELIIPLVVSAIIDSGIRGQNMPLIIQNVLIMVGLGLIGLVCAISAQYFAAKAAVGFTSRVKSALFRHIQSLSWMDQDRLGTSTLMTRMTSDMNQMQNGVNLALRLFLRSPFVVFGAMVMAFTINVEAALIFVAVIAALIVVVFGIMLITMPLYKKVQNRLDSVLSRTRENLNGVRVLRAFRKEESEETAFTQDQQALTKMQLFVGRISALMNPVTYVMINAATLVLIHTGAWKVEGGILTQGQVVALVNYMSQILVELIKMANLIVSMTKAAASANRIESVFDVKPSMKWKEENGKEQKNGLKKASQGENAVSADLQDWTSKYSRGVSVTFQQVSLKYSGAGDASLSDISFQALPGQTIGVIGGTGCGKSTLVNLIPRFYDATTGSVLVDGKDVRDYSQSELRQMIAVVPQKAELFSGTIESNLRWGKQDATEVEMIAALSQAQALDFVQSKPDGIQTKVEQNGRNFSGGQRQRLTIARALIRDPKILILDDSTSALDFATDAALRREIANRKNPMTTFIVSQRAASIMHADLILVLEDGHTVGMGTHRQLLENCSVYQEIYYSQFPKEVSAHE